MLAPLSDTTNNSTFSEEIATDQEYFQVQKKEQKQYEYVDDQ